MNDSQIRLAIVILVIMILLNTLGGTIHTITQAHQERETERIQNAMIEELERLDYRIQILEAEKKEMEDPYAPAF